MTSTIKARAEAWWNQWHGLAMSPAEAAGRAPPVMATTVADAAATDSESPIDPRFDYVDLFEHAPVGDLLLNSAGCIEKINRTGAAMLGWDATWLVGKPFSRWVVNNDKQLFAAHQRELQDCAQCASQELRIKNRQGRPVSLRLESVRARNTPDSGFVSRSIMLDVSGDERSARKLRRLQAQLTHFTRLHTAGELASSLAHELNQPLGIIVLNCDAALRLLDGGEGQDYEFAEVLVQTREAASFASDIVRHLRDFLRHGSDLHTVCGLDGLIRDVATLIEVDARDSDIDLSLDIEPGLPAVRVDSVQIKQVLLNLAHNSIEAMNDTTTGGANHVVIGAHRRGAGQIRLRVADTGPGFRLDEIDRPFDPFYTRKPEGMGMGLSISRTIVEAHGGTLWIGREPGDGATLYFTLPAIDDVCDDS